MDDLDQLTRKAARRLQWSAAGFTATNKPEYASELLAIAAALEEANAARIEAEALLDEMAGKEKF